jgi:hypothetical protein
MRSCFFPLFPDEGADCGEHAQRRGRSPGSLLLSMILIVGGPVNEGRFLGELSTDDRRRIGLTQTGQESLCERFNRQALLCQLR